MSLFALGAGISLAALQDVILAGGPLAPRRIDWRQSLQIIDESRRLGWVAFTNRLQKRRDTHET